MDHQKKNKCELQDGTPVTTHSWKNYQNKLNDVYEKVPANFVIDINIEKRKVKEEEEAEDKKRKKGARIKQRAEKREESKRLKTEKEAANDEKEAANDDDDDEETQSVITTRSTSSQKNTETECENTLQRSTRHKKKS